MLDLIKRKLSLKVAIALQLITLPPMIVAAFLLSGRQTSHLEQVMMNSAVTAAKGGAKAYATLLESGVDSGVLTLGDVFDTSYEEIKGFDWGDAPRFHTKYDFYTDRTAVGLQDTILASSPDFLFVAGNDVNGYVPTHDSKFTVPLTGDRAKDFQANRAKRKFTKVAQAMAGHELEPFTVQPYKRDTGEEAWDVSAPILVKGQRWGSLHIGVSIASLTAQKRSLLIELFGMLGALGMITTGFIFYAIWRSMKPLERLTALADEISSGEKLDQPIKPTTTDEIGQMAKSLNRMRSSLQAAMARLGE
jgi:HAMP domain-containing protein